MLSIRFQQWTEQHPCPSDFTFSWGLQRTMTVLYPGLTAFLLGINICPAFQWHFRFYPEIYPGEGWNTCSQQRQGSSDARTPFQRKWLEAAWQLSSVTIWGRDSTCTQSCKSWENRRSLSFPLILKAELVSCQESTLRKRSTYFLLPPSVLLIYNYFSVF